MPWFQSDFVFSAFIFSVFSRLHHFQLHYLPWMFSPTPSLSFITTISSLLSPRDRQLLRYFPALFTVTHALLLASLKLAMTRIKEMINSIVFFCTVTYTSLRDTYKETNSLQVRGPLTPWPLDSVPGSTGSALQTHTHISGSAGGHLERRQEGIRLQWWLHLWYRIQRPSGQRSDNSANLLITEVIVGGGVVLKCIIWGGVSNVFMSIGWPKH